MRLAAREAIRWVKAVGQLERIEAAVVVFREADGRIEGQATSIQRINKQLETLVLA